MPEVVLRVDMMCQGCVGAVTRILSKTEGVTSFDVQLEAKKVVVQGTASPELLLEKVGKTGKATSLWTE